MISFFHQCNITANFTYFCICYNIKKMDPKLGFAIIPPEWNPYDHAFLGVPIKLGEYFLDSLADLPFEVEFIYSKGCSK